MYGFGDDRNPASDTVNVMEEILIEFITDVVRPVPGIRNLVLKIAFSVKQPGYRRGKLACPSRTCAGRYHGQQMLRSLLGWRNCCSCKKTSNERALNSWIQTVRTQMNTSLSHVTLFPYARM